MKGGSVKTKTKVGKPIVFKTKDGKEVSFVPKPKTAVEKKKRGQMKLLEQRLTKMEKAILDYNNAVQAHQERKKNKGGESQDGASAGAGDKLGKGKKATALVVDAGKKAKV